MKEVRIKLEEQLYQRLKRIAKRELRATSKQAMAYITKGLNEDERQVQQEAQE